MSMCPSALTSPPHGSTINVLPSRVVLQWPRMCRVHIVGSPCGHVTVPNPCCISVYYHVWFRWPGRQTEETCTKEESLKIAQSAKAMQEFHTDRGDCVASGG